jgi:arginine decarboxylase
MPARRASRIARRGTTESPPAAANDISPPMIWTPTRLFFASGIGTHETERAAIQRAMREAGVADCNLVKTSSVIPPGCEILSRMRGLRMLRAGSIVHAVIAEGQTSEPYQRITPAICWAQPEDPGLPGYMTEIEEDHARGRSTQSATDEAGEALITIIGETLGVRVDSKKLWSQRGRSRRVRIGRMAYRVGSIAESTAGPDEEDGKSLYAVAVVLGVFL